MALTVDKLRNHDRFTNENTLQVFLYMPFGIVLMVLRLFLALILWIASIILPNKWAIRQVLSTLACWTFGVYVKLKGTRDSRCSVLVANYVSCLDSLAASHVLGTISLRKWKLPPFFASTLGIRNAAQFIRKQHFADSPSKPVLLQPEGGPTNGKGLLKFTDWPFQLGNRVQPVTISVEHIWTQVTVQGSRTGRLVFPWWDVMWFLWRPFTAYTVQLLPALERHDDDDSTLSDRCREAIAEALRIEVTEYKCEELIGGTAVVRRREPSQEALRLARQVKEVLPAVPIKDILRDLASTRSVDVTITNFLEGITPYTPEAGGSGEAEAGPSAATPPGAAPPAPRYVSPAPTGVFPASARERQLSFQERKAQMIAEARKRYIEKHRLNVALTC